MLSSAEDKSRAQTCKICKTWMRTKITQFQEIKWLESWCIICLFILHKLSIRCPKRDSYQIERPLLEIIEKLKFVYVCHQKYEVICVGQCVLLLFCYKAITQSGKNFCWRLWSLYSRRTKYVLKLLLCLYKRNPPVVS